MSAGNDDIQWAVVTYLIDAGLADVVSNTLSELDFNQFTISSRNDRKLDLVCYGKGGELPQAVRDSLSHLPLISEDIRAQNDLIASADDRLPVSICPGVLLIPEDPVAYAEPEIPIYLGRGPAFGDGRHPTTRSAAVLMRDLGGRINWSGTWVLVAGFWAFWPKAWGRRR